MVVRAAETSIIEGGVTSPKGFRAAGVHCGVKASKRDLALVTSERLASAAALFTTNAIKAAPVLVSQEKIQSGVAQAILVNSGNANACTGTQGLSDAREMTALAALQLGIAEEFVLVASTGVIGVPLPMGAVRKGIPEVIQALGPQGGADAADAIVTTDAFPKTAAAQVELGGALVTIGGMAKGAGMIHPNMATTLCVLTTDALIPPHQLRWALRGAIDRSFNCISVDGDTSTNDTVFCLANGLAGNAPLVDHNQAFDRFTGALDEVTTALAKMVVRDGEGASKVGNLLVRGARSSDDAKRAATAVMTSPLVKTALCGGEPNWGRILAAVGRSGAGVNPGAIDLWIGGVLVVRNGTAASPDLSAAASAMRAPEVEIIVDLHLGDGMFTGWFSDLNEGYVKVNAGYLT
ncbi:MAG: bifunctional glutamate N-acetyltransferase/amino-acid acetyltransferase ArgJ [Bacillati bacterium ANGP1]|uniref:Arginine biosynthesis bifunctional protein ArgJ n=1 Tax=Candidatus Segetimicrobium genomatis TaxID=2569760 RepID=A0A537J038_9BACT|nr:MAG: bifunctional glutamate N-acetyltransferase/amino-acid acetyltransferase ArgJ [Terrabacteria group bacterium ANGP1]